MAKAQYTRWTPSTVSLAHDRGVCFSNTDGRVVVRRRPVSPIPTSQGDAWGLSFLSSFVASKPPVKNQEATTSSPARERGVAAPCSCLPAITALFSLISHTAPGKRPTTVINAKNAWGGGPRTIHSLQRWVEICSTRDDLEEKGFENPITEKL